MIFRLWVKFTPNQYIHISKMHTITKKTGHDRTWTKSSMCISWQFTSRVMYIFEWHYVWKRDVSSERVQTRPTNQKRPRPSTYFEYLRHVFKTGVYYLLREGIEVSTDRVIRSSRENKSYNWASPFIHTHHLFLHMFCKRLLKVMSRSMRNKVTTHPSINLLKKFTLKLEWKM